MAAVTICSNFGAQEKASHCFHFFPTCLPWSDGTGCHDLSFFPSQTRDQTHVPYIGGQIFFFFNLVFIYLFLQQREQTGHVFSHLLFTPS